MSPVAVAYHGSHFLRVLGTGVTAVALLLIVLPNKLIALAAKGWERMADQCLRYRRIRDVNP